MTVAIICEYNPFHTGHAYQIQEIRSEFGIDTDIIAIMSGNFTQRGDVAVADKYLRAEWATLAGVNLVLELPFPYSMSSAEIFAKSAVKIIADLGCVDAISFGSENGNINTLEEIAENMLCEKYKSLLSDIISSSASESIGYPKACELAYNKAFSKELCENFFTPNNILAIEYIKAVLEFDLNLKLHTVKRLGASYNDDTIKGEDYQSAMAIREALRDGRLEAISFLPKEIQDSFKRHYNAKDFPTDGEKLSPAVISYFRLNDCHNIDFFDVGGGLYNRLKNASFEASDIKSLISLSVTKKFTNARIRRGIWYSFLGVTSSDVKKLPEFSQVLAFDKKGQALLKVIKKIGKIPLITKPSSKEGLTENGMKQKLLLDKADSVFQLAKPKAVSGAYSLRAKPFVKKC